MVKLGIELVAAKYKTKQAFCSANTKTGNAKRFHEMTDGFARHAAYPSQYPSS